MASLNRSFLATVVAVGCSFLAVILATGVYVSLDLHRVSASLPPDIGWHPVSFFRHFRDPVFFFRHFWPQLVLLATAVFIAVFAVVYRHRPSLHQQ